MNKLPIGTFINMGAVLLGGSIGLLLQQTFSAPMQEIVFQAIGLGTLVIGIQMSTNMPEGYLLAIIFSLIAGGLIGVGINLEGLIDQTGEYLKNQLGSTDARFSEGLIAAFLLFCMGSMTILASIEEGMHGKRDLIKVKSLLDGVSSIAFTATYGIGVMVVIFPMFIYQGGLTLLSRQARTLTKPAIVQSLSSTGGMLIVGIGINMLGLGDIQLEALLPSIVIIVIYAWFKETQLRKMR
ncbi:MAG: DUF554 domain-containing protein [Saprospiraceae bacterium]|jgi:uncharacterized protein|nr:DUF554 domain-containing protein [Saprospiraceae bacterium]MDP5000204.1 DUF554 domain-containing protein [Saprospiraceae bacterium]